MDDRDKQVIYLYTVERLGARRIANRIGIGKKTVYNILKKHNISTDPYRKPDLRSECYDSIRMSKDEWVKIARNKHGDKYDYSLVDYINNHTRVTIICPDHGEYIQLPKDHTQGHGCLWCAKEVFRKDNAKDTKQFIKEAMSIHGDLYDYSTTKYVTAKLKVDIKCSYHGIFKQKAIDHLYGHGCPKCSTIVSSGHQDIIDYIKSIYNGTIIINDKTLIYPYEIDIVIPDEKLAIEFNGLYWHSYGKKETTDEKRRHQRKVDRCEDIGFNLFQIWENQWYDSERIVKSMISGKLGLNKRIYARKCNIIELSNDSYKQFMQDHHLQGYVNASIKYGLLHDNTLMSVISFNKHQKYQWEISRFASNAFHTVTGGFSKLLFHFVKEIKPFMVCSYANRDHSCGNLYDKNGFKLLYKTEPGYCYTDKHRVFSRQKFQKHKLSNVLKEFDRKLSEPQNMFNNGYRRVWNSGNKFYLKKFNY